MRQSRGDATAVDADTSAIDADRREGNDEHEGDERHVLHVIRGHGHGDALRIASYVDGSII